jgi:hypothetical protein
LAGSGALSAGLVEEKQQVLVYRRSKVPGRSEHIRARVHVRLPSIARLSAPRNNSLPFFHTARSRGAGKDTPPLSLKPAHMPASKASPP